MAEETTAKPRAWWVGWVGLGVVLTMNWWWTPVYRAVPTFIWMALLAVGFVAGVWRWIAFFLELKHGGA